MFTWKSKKRPAFNVYRVTNVKHKSGLKKICQSWLARHWCITEDEDGVHLVTKCTGRAWPESSVVSSWRYISLTPWGLERSLSAWKRHHCSHSFLPAVQTSSFAVSWIRNIKWTFRYHISNLWRYWSTCVIKQIQVSPCVWYLSPSLIWASPISMILLGRNFPSAVVCNFLPPTLSLGSFSSVMTVFAPCPMSQHFNAVFSGKNCSTHLSSLA